jgi:hypothetical protein
VLRDFSSNSKQGKNFSVSIFIKVLSVVSLLNANRHMTKLIDAFFQLFFVNVPKNGVAFVLGGRCAVVRVMVMIW